MHWRYFLSCIFLLFYIFLTVRLLVGLYSVIHWEIEEGDSWRFMMNLKPVEETDGDGDKDIADKNYESILKNYTVDIYTGVSDEFICAV